jgi:hypothetical protein
MKAKRIPFVLLAMVAMAALLAWKFWLAQNAASAQTTARPTPATTTVAFLSTTAPQPEVVAPKLPPTPASSDSGELSPVENGGVLYDASKARAAAPISAHAGDDDYDAVLKGSPELAKLDSQMAENAAVTQAATLIDPNTLPPMVVTDLGDIALTEGQPVIKTLASGGEVRLTLSTSIVGFGGNGDGVKLQNIEADFIDPNAKQEVMARDSSSGETRAGQPVVIKSISTGNEIHFVPEFTIDPAAK